MSTQQSGIDYQSLKQKVGSSSDWPSATQELRTHPQYPEQVSQSVEQAYNATDPQTQQALDQMDPETKTSFFHLIGKLNQMGAENREQTKKVSEFLTNCISQSTGSSSR